MIELWKVKRNQITSWKTVLFTRPSQPDPFNCGVCVCLFAEHFTAERSLDYINDISPADLEFFRRKMLCELVNHTFLEEQPFVETELIQTTITIGAIDMIF